VRRTLVLAFGAALALGGVARAQSSPILPGYWDSDEHYSVLLSGGGHARKCLTEAQVAQFIQAPQTSHYRCRYASRVVGDGQARFRGGACYNKHGRLTLSDVSVDGRYSPDAFHLDFSFGLNLSAGVALPGTAHIDARRIAAQCPVTPEAGQ
jgi:hypothetical protein